VDAQKTLKIQDYYTVYLWNYCSWNGNDKYSFCSPRQSEFWFNPVEVWGLNGTNAESLFPKELKDGLNTYKNVAKYMFIVYVIALVATAIELLIGMSAMFSRWGSFVTTFFAAVSRPTAHSHGSSLIWCLRSLSSSLSQPLS
jgi:SUR7/PalI family